jgi:hypothetical protein
VPEFIPYFGAIDPIFETIDRLLTDPHKLAQTSTQLVKLTKPLGQTKVSREVSKIIIEILEYCEKNP